MSQKRFVIEMDCRVEMGERGVFAGGHFTSVAEALVGVTPLEILDEWNLLPDLRVIATDRAQGPVKYYEYVGGGIWGEYPQ